MMTSSHAQANVAPGAEDAAAAGHAVPVPASPPAADVIQREMEHLREMVFALSREVASERAARDRLQRTVDAWEDPGDSTNGTWTGGIGAAADEEVGSQSGDSPNAPLFGSTDSSHAPEAAASYSRNRANVTHTETPPGRRAHFIGSPGADDQPPEAMRIDGSAKWWQVAGPLDAGCRSLDAMVGLHRAAAHATRDGASCSIRAVGRPRRCP